MTSKMPPTPPANRSPKGVGDIRKQADVAAANGPKNPDKIGQQGNSNQNTTHQGYQQDR